MQRIGLSATQRPLAEIGRFVAGAGREIELVDAGTRKELDLEVVVPLEDMRELGSTAELSVPPLADGVQMGVGVEQSSRSIWPSIYPAILDLVRSHRSTIVFVNNRRLAERLALRLNELAGEELARAHHGSLAREQRVQVEELLKAGRIPCLVATSSLELGIDMGVVDLVVQVESPKSVARGLQRVGRAGHELDLEGQDLPEVPGGPARVGGRRSRDARGRDRGDSHPAESDRRPRPADRRHLRRRGGVRGRAP
jgi:ATP-dependent Lhr-like helicase